MTEPQSAGAAPRVIVTGAEGFVGRHLLRCLEARGLEARGTTIESLPLPDRAGFARLAAARPEAVVHLAGISFVPDAERDPAGALTANVDGTRSVLEGLRDADAGGKARMVFISTAQVYRPSGGGAIDEDCPIEPRSVYGFTKLAGEAICRVLCQVQPARPLVVFRPFNHTGPGQRPDFAASNFARQVALIEAGKQEPVLHTGNLSARRDFCDVRDVVEAYAMAAAGQVPPGTYNIAAGRTVSLAEVAEHYRSIAAVKFEIREKREKVRQGEAPEVRGSADRLTRAAGWRPAITLEKTLGDMLAEWRAAVAGGSGGTGAAAAAGERGSAR
jgi:GDP-4-dehydro-6-deoxy-D-mannose reductase